MIASTEKPKQEEIDTLVAAGEAIYNRIRAELEKDHFGEYLSIEPESGDYFIHETPYGSLKQLKDAYPDRVGYSVQIGYDTFGSMGASRK